MPSSAIANIPLWQTKFVGSLSHRVNGRMTCFFFIKLVDRAISDVFVSVRQPVDILACNRLQQTSIRYILRDRVVMFPMITPSGPLYSHSFKPHSAFISNKCPILYFYLSLEIARQCPGHPPPHCFI
jgi:hypothetical protein